MRSFINTKYRFHQEPYRFGLYLHLATALPAGFLGRVFTPFTPYLSSTKALLLIAPLQFIPAIRAKKIIFHRILGYFELLMILLACVGAVMLSRRVLSEDPAGYMHAIVFGGTTLFTLFMAWINIKRLQIDQHRKWMLRYGSRSNRLSPLGLHLHHSRAWGLLGSVITVRLIVLAAPQYIDRVGSYSIVSQVSAISTIFNSLTWFTQTYSCDNILFNVGGNSTLLGELFPACLTAPNLKTFFIAVTASRRAGGILGYVATLRLSYTLAAWLSVFIHMVL